MTDAKKPWEQQYGGSAPDGGAEPWKQDYGPDAAAAPAAPRGLKGWGQDIAATAVKGAIAVPEALVGLADIPTGGRVGKFLENEGGALGFRPKQAKEAVNDWHSEATKEAQRKFQEADGVLEKTGVALSNPSLIATAVGESLPVMGLGGVAARGLQAGARALGLAARPATTASGALTEAGAATAARQAGIAGAAGEGLSMAGSQAEAIRQETEDGLLTPGQAGLSLATGAVGGLFGVGGNKLSQRLGIGDGDTMMAQGMKGLDQQIAGNAARAAANPLVAEAAVKSIPRKVIEGAIAEGFLEELPQSMAEQIFQNLALDKPWHEELDSAAVMGVLSGGAMGAGAAGFKGFRESGANPADGTAPGETGQPEQGGPTPGGDMVRNALNESLLMLPAPVIDVGSDGVARTAADRNARLQRLATGDVTDITPVAPAPTPSEAMGLRSGPDAGSLENAAALAVDTGATAQVQQEAALAQAAEAAQKGKPATQKQEQPAQAQQEIDQETGEITGLAGLQGWSDSDLSTSFRNAQSKDVRMQLAQELSRRRAAREEEELQAELQAEQAAADMPDAPDGAFARVQEDAGSAPKNIEVQGEQAAAAPQDQSTAPGAQAEGANVATLAQLNRKKLAEMTDDELQQLSALLPADHSRQQKIQKAIQARAEQAQPAINQGAEQDGKKTDQAQQAGAKPAQAGAAQASQPAGQGLTNGATPAQDNGRQASAPTAPQAQAQELDREQRAKRMDEAGAQWTRMPAAERSALVGRLEGVRPVLAKNMPRAEWGNLNVDIQRKLADAMAPKQVKNSTPANREIDLAERLQKASTDAVANNSATYADGPVGLIGLQLSSQARIGVLEDELKASTSDADRAKIQKQIDSESKNFQSITQDIAKYKEESQQVKDSGKAKKATPDKAVYEGSPDDWRNTLMKTRVHAKALIDAGKLDGAAAQAAWTDHEKLLGLVDGKAQSNQAAQAIKKQEAETGKTGNLMQAAKQSGKLEVVHVGDKPAKPESKAKSPLVQAMNDLAEVRSKIEDQGQVVDDRLLQRERQLKAMVKELNEEWQKESAATQAKDKPVTDNPAEYGASNKLVSQSRADELRAKLREKAKNNMFGGLDTEMMAWGTELAVFHLEAGVRKFSDLVAAMASDLGTTPAKLKPYLRSWYNGARDMMEDHGLSIEGMDSPETVRAELAKIGSDVATENQAKSNAPSLSESLLAEIRAGNMPKDNPALKKLVEAFDGKPADQARMKEAQEQLESAIVSASREIVAKGEGDKSTFDALLRLYESQPNLNVRTSTSIANQAYSTPAPLAYLASQLAGITPQTLTHEPTAGTGMLLIGADPKNAVVNELNDLRIELLKQQGFTPTQKDAATEPLRDKRGPVDAVITNPPFGSVKDENGKAIKVKVDGYNLGQIDHLIAARALETMKDDGRAVLILGANKAPGGLSTDDRIFFNWLYSHYNVVGHFEVEGDLYARQGAGWPVRVITIAGREQSSRISPVAGTVQRVDNWNQVYDQYKQLLDTSGRPVRSAGAAAGRPVEGQTQPAAVPVAAGPQAANADRPGRGERTGGNGNVAGARAGTVSDLTGATTDPVGHEPDEQRLNAQSFVPPRLDEAGQGAKPNPAKRPAKPAGTTAVADAPAEAGNEFQSSYVPRSARKDAGVLIPSNMAQPTQDALNHLEDQVGDIDEFARQELGYESTEALHNALMGLQVDSVAMAIHQIKQGKAVVIADQTGIGKGRQAASVIRWAVRNGMTPVFVSVKPSLFTDMYGDLADIGTHDVEPFILNSDAWVSGKDGEKLFANKASTHRAAIEAIANNGALPAGRNALFMTYSQINTDNAQRRALRALAGNAVFVLDESHNAAGASGTGDFMISVLKEAKGVTYLSATYAKRPDNMPLYFKTDIGDAAADSEGLANAMAAGGLPLQTVVSNNLVKAGQMFRRERSYDGVSIASTFDTKNRALHEGMSDTATQALRSIVRADRLFHEIYVKQLQKEIKAEGGDIKDIAGNQAAAGVQHTEFSSVVHNFVRQMLLGLKAQTAADEAIASLKRGEKPIIAVENTMGSFLSEYASSNGLTQGDSLGSFDYRTVLSRALERSRALVETLPTGEEVRRTIPLSSLDPITRKAYDQAQEIIDGLKIAIPVSPIDWMRAEIERAGFSVAEITGRNLSVDYSEKGNPVLSSIDQAEQRDKVGTTRRFNGGELDALILNVAGSTGISLHASEKFQDQRQRHMIVAQAAGDINIFMQMLGRIHRTGQVRLPKYTILSVDLPTEKRPTAVLSKKMKSLNANTSSNTESATSVKTADILNKYGDQIVHQYLQDNMELARQLGVDDIVGGDNPAEDIARKATGRLALQPIAVQNGFYEDVEAQYDALIEYLNKTNQNDLEPRTFDFDAKEMRSEVLFEGPNKETPFGEDAIYGEYSIKAQGTPMTPEEIKEAIDTNLGGKTGAEHADALLEHMDSQYKEFVEKLSAASKGASVIANEEGEYDATKHDAVGDVLSINKAIESAGVVRQAGIDFLRSHAIGRIFRVEINSEPFNAVVTNVRNTHKGTGNPYSLSKLQLTVSVNGALRSITVPATQFKKIEVSSVAPTFRVEQLFKEQPPNQRETAKIITGNLLAAYGELKGVKGTIISFTKSDGGTEQGILLPKLFDYAKNTQGDYRLRSGAEALNFLQRSENKDIGRFGIATRDGLVRVLPYGDGIQVRVPRSKAQGARYFLDKNLIAIAGDFVSTANAMAAKVENPADAEKLLDLLMDKQALYALPSMADEAKAMAPKDTANFEGAAKRRPGSAQDKAVMQAIADGKSARDVLRVVASGSKDPFLRQVARLLLKTGITPNIEFGHIGLHKGNPIHGQYRGKTDTIAIAGSAEYAAERIFMHEAMHAATMRALAKPGLARLQLQRLAAHVRKQPGAAGFYGISDKDGNVDEFVAEVFTNPDFQAALRQMKAPSDSGTIKTAWDGFVRILRSILGLKNDPNNALSQALQLGVAAMREDMALRKQGTRGEGSANAGADQVETESFQNWYGDWQNAAEGVANGTGRHDDQRGNKALNALQRQGGVGANRDASTRVGNFTFPGTSGPLGRDGKPARFFHGTRDDFSTFDGGAATRKDAGWLGAGFYFDSHPDTAGMYAGMKRGSAAPSVMPVYVNVRNPYVASDAEKREMKHWTRPKLEQHSKLLQTQGYDGVALVDEEGGIELVAFKSTQIKSATGNNGNFDPEDPSILNFGTDDIARVKAGALDFLQQSLSHPGKVSWWDKSIGTMRNLAERVPQFKPVFEAAQRFIDDVSMLANDAADFAPRLLPRVESWRDLKKKPITAADNKAVAKPLFEGTLMWARDMDGTPVTTEALNDKYRNVSADEKAQILLRTGKLDDRVLKMWKGMPIESFEKAVSNKFESTILKPGVVWTAKELQSIFGLNDQQVSLYQEARAAIDRSLDMTARTDMLRIMGEDFTNMREAVLGQETMQDAFDLVVETLQAEARANPDMADRLMGMNNAVVNRHATAQELMDKGYAPLSRFGKYTVDVVDANGERQYFGMFESQRESNLMKLKMASVFPGATITQGTMSEQAFKLFQGITPESLEQFGEMLGLKGDGDEAKDKAFQAYLQLAKNNHSALKRLIHRKGIDGYSEDVGRVLASFVYSNARLGSGGLNAGTMEKAVGGIPKEMGELRDVAMQLRSYIQDPQEEGQAIRGMLFAQYLGGSVASAMVNMTQPFQITMPWLSQYGGMGKAAKQMARALNDMRRSWMEKGFTYEPDLAKALKEAEDDGTVSPQEIHQLMAQARGTGSLRTGDGTKMGDARAAAANNWERVKVAWGQPFALAEQFNRRSTFIASYRIAKEQGMSNPAEFARKAVLETQFLYSKANKMRWGRGAVGGTLMTFKTYSVSYLELMHRMWTQGGPEGKRAVGWAVAMLLLMSGAGGLPFMEDAEDLIDGAAQMMGYNFSTKQARKEYVNSIVGKELGEFMEQGVSGLPGAPIDVSGRLGMGDLIPGTGLFMEKQNRMRDLLEIAGPAGDLVSRGFTGARKALTGDFGDAALEVSPTAVRNWAKGADMWFSGIYKDTKGYKVMDVTLGEAVAKFAGFQPKSVAEDGEASSFKQRTKSFYIQTSAEIKAQWAAAVFNKDEAALERVRGRLEAWNRNNPDLPIVVKIPDIMKKVREMGKDREQRINDNAPKALRQQFREMAQEAAR